MSVDTITTCTSAQRFCRTKRRLKRGSTRNDPTSQSESTEIKIPEIQIDEDLGLDLLEVCDIPKDMLFPGEYNVYLQDRLKSMGEENKQLSVLLQDRENEIASMKEKLLKVDSEQNGGLSLGFASPDSLRYADMAVHRVMNLSKQVCELTAQLEEQRGRCALAETKLLSFLETQEEKQPVPAEVLAHKEVEIKSLSDKLNASNSKLFECRNKVLSLQQELKSAHKVLLSEVGDGVSIPALIAMGGSTCSWRGRAQQIQLLQQKVIELTDRLKKCSDFRVHESQPTAAGEGKSSTKERKASVEVAQQETKLIQQQLNEYIRKLDAAKARIKVLESEISSFKVRIQQLSDREIQKDDFILILQGQVNQLERHLQLCKEEARSGFKKSEKQYQQLLEDYRMEKQRSMQLLSSLEDEEKQMKRLENILFDLKDKEVTASKTNPEHNEEANEALVLSSYSVPLADNSIKESLRALPIEREIKKFLEVVGTLNRRLNDARHDCDKHKSALRLERQRLAKLEAKLARMEIEKSSSFLVTKRQMASKGKIIASSVPTSHTSMSKEELEDKLELLQEEVLTLKTRLTCLEQEKEDDFRAFSSVLYGSTPQQTPLKQISGTSCLPVIKSP